MSKIIPPTPPRPMVHGDVCNGKWEAGGESTAFLSPYRSQDGFLQQNVSNSFTILPRSLQLTENSVWKRNWKYAGCNNMYFTPNTGSECPRPERRVLKPHLSIPATPGFFPRLYLLLQDTARPLPVIRPVVHIHMNNSPFDLQRVLLLWLWVYQ